MGWIVHTRGGTYAVGTYPHRRLHQFKIIIVCVFSFRTGTHDLRCLACVFWQQCGPIDWNQLCGTLSLSHLESLLPHLRRVSCQLGSQQRQVLRART